MSAKSTKLGLNATWSMAVGGMIGGGIFSTLGVVVSIAGKWAWLSFVFAGLIALATGYSYVQLLAKYREGGGAFTFLRKINKEEAAGSLAWVLIVGYVLTNSVYAFTFGQYLGHVLDLGPWFPRFCAMAVVAAFVGVNLRGVGEAGHVEIFLVWFKLVILLTLAIWGITQGSADNLSANASEAGWQASILGAASVFMAYEGFQLLTYDYEDIDDPAKKLPLAMMLAIASVIVVYVLVALGTTMLIGAGKVVEHEEVSLAIAGQQAFGMAGLVLVTIGAAFSTGSAINATMFATARLAKQVAEAKHLPHRFTHTNERGIPDTAVIDLGVIAAILAGIGSLSALVEAASLAFLLTFSVVCAIAFQQKVRWRGICGFGCVAAIAAALALLWQLYKSHPFELLVLVALVLISVFGRPWLMDKIRKP